MSENNDTSNESNSLGSDSILQASRLTGGGANPVLRSGVLRPSVLGQSVLGSTSNSANTHNAASGNDSGGAIAAEPKVGFSNPFMREEKNDDNEDDGDGDPGAVGGDADKDKEGSSVDGKKVDEDDEQDERPDPLSLLRKNGLERANLFAAAKNSIPRVEKSGFVFGQNVHERVVGENINPENTSKSENSETGSTSGELLFSSVIQNAAKANEGAESSTASKETETKSLTDVAREYEESRAQKRKYEEVETFTGEENEVNIVDINCKLFAFVNSNWEERGRGSLRLNDSKNEQECSRVVFRTSGNLRLLLNTKVWAGMVAERPSQKSLRLTAMDSTAKIKIFLVMGRPADISQLHKALVERIDLRKISHPEECRAAASENNGAEVKNGAAAEVADETEEAASVAEPEHDDCNAPSPKKSLLGEGEN